MEIEKKAFASEVCHDGNVSAKCDMTISEQMGLVIPMFTPDAATC